MALHVETAGDPAAPAVLFLHGLGTSSWMWEEQLRHLSDRFHCIAVDLPGSGGSHGVPWRSFADTADAIAAVVGATPTGRAHVVGLSLGGYAAVTLAVRHPEAVDGLVACGITTAPLYPLWRSRMLSRVGGTVMRTPVLTRAYGHAMRLPAEARDAMAGDARLLSAETVRRVYAEILPFRLPGELAAHGSRVLAVAADHDAPAIRHGLGAFAAVGATVATVPDAHHGWNGEHPRLFSDMVDAWVTGRTVPPGLLDPARGEPVE